MIQDLLTPIDNTEDSDNKGSFFNIRYVSGATLDDMEKAGIALITNHSDLSHEVRRCFKLFKNHFKNITTYDLGNLTSADSNTLSKLNQFLQSKKIVPVYLGVGHNSTAMHADLGQKDNNVIYQLCNKISNTTLNGQNINHIGYQRHLCEHSDILEVEEYAYHSISLGKMRSHPDLLEPILRDAHYLYIDMNAMRQSDAPNVSNCLPTGLYAEELCQIMRYIGNAGNIKAIYIDMELKNLQNTPEALLICEAFWYFAEGMNINSKDHPDLSSDFSEFIVYSSDIHDDLTFLKHNQTLRWWLRYITPDGVKNHIACSYEEYVLCTSEEVPERLLKFIHSFE